jgi:UDP-glucose 4-epimerase
VNEEPISWVVGAGGLLGSSVERALARRGPVWQPPRPISWATRGTYKQLRIVTGQFAAAVAGSPWQLAWCAGAGVMATTREALLEEEAVLDIVLDALSGHMQPGSDGTAFLASSAGGAYAGANDPPFSEDTPARPISPYGETRLGLEQRITEWATANGWRLVIGRISNLYGPGQNLAKPQGLISQLCRANLTRQPISLYVPSDTVRDYLYAPDCGDLVADLVVRARQESSVGNGQPTTKILASHSGVTIGALLNELRRVCKRSTKVVHGWSPAARFQARDLRFRSVVWPELDRRTLTTLPTGISATVTALTRRLQGGSLRT